MGKIVKYCAACEESFAEKFAFCPNCGQAMSAFEMNPVFNETAVSPKTAAPAESNEFNAIQDKAPLPAESPSVIEPNKVVSELKPVKFVAPAIESAPVKQTEDVAAEPPRVISSETKRESVKPVETAGSMPETKTFAAAPGAAFSSDIPNQPTGQISSKSAPDPDIEEFHITVIEEKNRAQRNLLLLGSMALMLTLTLGGTVYSLFNKDLMVGAIDQEIGVFVPVIEDEPMQTEEEEQPKKEDEGGGGGGGGRDKPTPTSKGQLATQTEKPLIAPTVTLVKKDFELKYQASTQGTKQIKQTDEPYGDPNSKYTLSSDGMGSGGGQGSGIGTGQGSGRGTGQGSGIGSGSGNGNGNGNGDGSGDGSGPRTPPPPPPKPVEVVSEPFRIISKPRPAYTDAARQNQVTGVVRLRVTFSASGSIGSIAPVSGLPYGLTEQAIAAARQIRFEPAKKNGVPVPSTKIIEYSFTIY